ncbi:hypothetical protein PN462_07215 [Spirulina sp. CS-785/01]|uniref:hypothetical protein n=1 Tax=Spirulina sp. CS-785/01 TaxID=3021716 RepID=UPI00232B41A7|nr:hypothetical protein [Spirulina sp. CS-785/01]MDB9312885.1 hypothetical protein [Spirulina sp. CS-785/01]
MNMFKWVEDVNDYLSEAIARIFSRNDDTYTPIGVQPFSGDLGHPKKQVEW